MTKHVIKVFPDHCSSGLWREDGCNVDPDEVGVSRVLQIALKYWHEVWEFCIAVVDEEHDGPSKMTDAYYQRWLEDGRELAIAMSNENDEFVFVVTNVTKY